VSCDWQLNAVQTSRMRRNEASKHVRTRCAETMSDNFRGGG